MTTTRVVVIADNGVVSVSDDAEGVIVLTPPSVTNVYDEPAAVAVDDEDTLVIAPPLPPPTLYFTTGDVKQTFKIVADTGWVFADDGSIGDASSGATTRHNADCEDLFKLFYNYADADVPLQTSAGAATTRAAQGTAAAAWAAHCRMVLPKMLGRLTGVAGAGSGLTSRAKGANTGAETVVLTTANLPPYTPAGNITGSAAIKQESNGVGGDNSTPTDIFRPTGSVNNTLPVTASFAGTAQGGTSSPVNKMPPSVFLNLMIKL